MFSAIIERSNEERLKLIEEKKKSIRNIINEISSNPIGTNHRGMSAENKHLNDTLLSPLHEILLKEKGRSSSKKILSEIVDLETKAFNFREKHFENVKANNESYLKDLDYNICLLEKMISDHESGMVFSASDMILAESCVNEAEYKFQAAPVNHGSSVVSDKISELQEMISKGRKVKELIFRSETNQARVRSDLTYGYASLISDDEDACEALSEIYASQQMLIVSRAATQSFDRQVVSLEKNLVRVLAIQLTDSHIKHDGVKDCLDISQMNEEVINTIVTLYVDSNYPSLKEAKEAALAVLS